MTSVVGKIYDKSISISILVLLSSSTLTETVHMDLSLGFHSGESVFASLSRDCVPLFVQMRVQKVNPLTKPIGHNSFGSSVCKMRLLDTIPTN